MYDKGKIMWKAVLADKEREEAAERQEQKKKINFEKKVLRERRKQRKPNKHNTLRPMNILFKVKQSVTVE